MNHFMYADDTVLIAPSNVALQKLIQCCSLFAKSNYMLFNTKQNVSFIILYKLYISSMCFMYLWNILF